jgi:hypothetical protein
MTLGVVGDKIHFRRRTFWKEWELDDYILATDDGFKAKCRCRGIEIQITNLIK